MTPPDEPQHAKRHSETGWSVQPDTPAAPGPSPLPDISAVDTLEGEANSEPPLSSVAVMILGVLGGFTLLNTWGWLEIARAYAEVNEATANASGIIGGVLQQIIFWISPLAPLAWFGTAYTIFVKHATWKLSLVLLIGVVLLLPYPILLGGASS